jgi:hypothetical protein
MEEPKVLKRKQARSQKVSITDPIMIRDKSGTTHLEVLLQFVPHATGPDQVSPKLTYWKKNKDGFRQGFPVEFTLNQEETGHLRDVLSQGLAIAKSSRDGNFLILPLNDASSTELENQDPGTVARALATLLSSDAILSAVQSDPDGRRLLEGIQLSLRTTEMKAAVGELESNLNNSVIKEQIYQVWCEEHSWAFGNAYSMRDEVRTIALGDQVDILMQLTTNRLRDIFELKRPDKEAIVFDDGHKSWYWSSETSKSIGQCHRYLDALHEAAAHGLRDNPELIAYHPRATIVIGRSKDWTEEQHKALHGLNSRLHGIQVITYDHLLAQAKQFLTHLDEPT